jgi:hypothetical protein
MVLQNSEPGSESESAADSEPGSLFWRLRTARANIHRRTRTESTRHGSPGRWALARARQDRATARSKENFPFLWKQWKPWQGLTTLIMLATKLVLINWHREKLPADNAPQTRTPSASEHNPCKGTAATDRKHRPLAAHVFLDPV